MNRNIDIYIDLTGILKNRINTGIQRVVKEFLHRTIRPVTDEQINYYYIEFDIKNKKYNFFSKKEIEKFLLSMADYELKIQKTSELLNQKKQIAIFFDIDSVWNIHPKRNILYPELKKNNFYIINFIYDLAPIILPQYSHENTCRNFVSFLSAVYAYADMVFFDSVSAEQDFLKIKKQVKVEREIPTRVIGLGADFFQKKEIETKNNYQYLFGKKYLLFVGTIEPRKDQEIVLNAFEKIAEKYPDLNLIFIGKQGWKVEKFINRIQNHKLINKRFFYLNSVTDNELSLFYKNAWIVIYLSKHEGYGLPIAESLKYGNITIASKNSSMYEVGRNFTDYVVYNSQNEIIDNISLYYENSELYEEKKKYIQNFFVSDNWDRVSATIFDIFQFFPDSIKEKSLAKPQNLQFIFISIEIEVLQESIVEIDKYIDFVKEYIIITSSDKVKTAKEIISKNTITVFDEDNVLKDYSDNFLSRDHVQKNWLLRASILNIDNLDDNFIMLDDDSRPLKKITIDYFISPEGRFNAYYFYDLLNWNSSGTDYDKGQKNLVDVLSDKKYESLSYSSHAPQIINKKLLNIKKVNAAITP